MKIVKKLYDKYKEIIKYIFFGVLTTIVSILSFSLFNLLLGVDYYLISNIISWIISVVFAFLTNKLWVFSSESWERKIVLKEGISFILARVVSLLIEEVGLVLLIDVLDFGNIQFMQISGALLAKTIMQVIVILTNYILSKKFIFNRED